jgi:phosphoglycolate phosphatase
LHTCLFFDLDGTLTDPREGIVGCLRHALQQLDLPLPSDDELAQLIGPPLHESLSKLLGSARAHHLPSALEHYRERFRTVGMFENSVYPGVPEALTKLAAAGWRLWVVTSKPLAFALPILEHFELARHFVGIHGSELSGERSNKAELIAHVRRTERIAADEAIMIGDRSHDVRGARSNNVASRGVLWGYGSREELVQAGADGLFASVDDLVSELVALRADAAVQAP